MTDAASLEDVQRQVCNWGRWGPDDERGTFNLIGPAQRLAAASLIQDGLAVSLSHDIDPSRNYFGPKPARFMLRTGPDEALDVLQLPVHGVLDTHLDSLGHFFDGDIMYGGRSAREHVSASEGLARSSIVAAKEGILTRGVLLDVPAWRAIDCVPGGQTIGRSEILAAEEKLGFEIGVGDAVLLRTGHSRLPGVREVSAFTSASWDVDVLPFLHERGVALVGCDGPNETLPSPVAGSDYPIHIAAIVYMGLWLMDNVALDGVAELCIEKGRNTFAFFTSPLAFPGATGSPVNPIAIL